MNDFLWWRDGIIYQIYPRSFADSTGSGLGDLPGITARLDYLSELGIDAIWLSPFYPSPDNDFGYDISDYCAVDPRYGSLDDFDELLQQAHQRGIRVVLDMVLNHTSDQHAWFRESRASRDNPKRDWYIWRSAAEINNWEASFGGKAWELDPATGEYFLHLFTREQPDLNWRNPAVRQALLDVFRFWLARGVDGFRLDVFNAYFKDEQLRSNPACFGLRGFDRQRHIYDIDQPEMLPLLGELRALLDTFPLSSGGFPERYAVGETYLATPEKIARYSGPQALHAAFSFDFTSQALIYPWNPLWLLRQVLSREATFSAAGLWPTTVMSNHDLPRAASRYALGEGDRMPKLAMALLLTLRGTPFMYYGEEIGMRDLSLKRGEIMDPPGKRYWPIYKGRDGCRSPMQWDDSPHAGFTRGQPWLKVHPNYVRRNVATQRADPGSLFNFTKALIALRKNSPALTRGDFSPLPDLPRGTLAFLRRTPGQTVLVALNFTSKSRYLPLPHGTWKNMLGEGQTTSDILDLAPYDVQFCWF